MIQNRSKKHVTEKDFDLIKTLLKNNASYKVIHMVTGRSTSTISYILGSDTYADYVKKIKEESERKHGKKNGQVVIPSIKIVEEATQLDRVEKKLDQLLSYLV